MSEPIKSQADLNAELALKQASQDISGKPTVTGDFTDSSAALDALAAQVKPKEPAAPAAGAEPAAPAAPVVPAKPAAAPPAGDPVTPPAPVVDDPVTKTAAELFKSSPALPPGVSPKSAEAFAAIKIKAAQEVVEREKKIAELTEQLKASKNPSTEQLEKEKELEEHRAWREKLDVDFDPKFKKFDTEANQHREFIYAQLKKNPAVSDDVIAAIKKYGGPDNVNMAKIFEKLNDPTLQRLIEAKLADVEQIKYNKDQAVKAAKENLAGYLGDREKTWKAASTQHATITKQKVDTFLPAFDWFKEKPATEPDAATHNEFIKTLKGQVEEAIRDDSPDMRAVLVTGMAKLFYLQREQETLTKKLADAEAKLAEVTGKWEKIKNSSRSRLDESAAPPGGGSSPAPVKVENQIGLRTPDALDAIAKQVMESKAAKAAA